MHPSFRAKRFIAGDRRHKGQAWAADKKRGIVPSATRPRAPRSHRRQGNGLEFEMERLAKPHEERAYYY